MKKYLFALTVVLSLFCFVPKVFAAIAFDSTSEAGFNNNGTQTTNTWNHTVGSGNNMVLVCGIYDNEEANGGHVTLTYDSVPMTQIGFNGSMEYFWLVSPTPGTNAVVVNLRNNWGEIIGQCASYSGVSNVQPTNVVSVATWVNPSISTTTLADAWLNGFFIDGWGNPMTAGAGTVALGTSQDSGIQMFDSGGALPAGLNSLSVVAGGGAWGTMVELDVAPELLSPVINSISPTSTVAGGGDFVLTVNGSSFNASSTVQWNGNNLVTTYVSSTVLTATVTAADILSASSNIPITVLNEDSSNVSNNRTFTVTPTVAPNISGVTVSNISTSSATISWTTDEPADTLVTYGPDFNFEYDQGITDCGAATVGNSTTPACLGTGSATGTTSHTFTLTGLYPGIGYSYSVRSRAFTEGIPDPAKASFSDSASFTTTAPTAGSFDYWVSAQGPHHVMAGYTVYVLASGHYLSGYSAGNGHGIYLSVSGMPPGATLDFPSADTGGCSTSQVNSSEIGFYDITCPEDFGLTVPATTTPGDYTLTLTFNSVDSPGPKTLTWFITVDPRTPLAQNTPTSSPPIPCLNSSSTEMDGTTPCPQNWTSNMVTYGQKWGVPGIGQNNYDAANWGGASEGAWYYDGARVYYQIHDYDQAHNVTNNPDQWNTYAQNWESSYLNYVVGTNYNIWGYSVFPHGLYMNYQRNGNSGEKTAVLALGNSYYTNGILSGIDPVYMREMSYGLNAERLAYDLNPTTAAATALARQADMVIGIVDQATVDQNTMATESFMLGLATESLIQYYEDGHTDNLQIPWTIKNAADWMWNNAWQTQNGPGEENNENSFYYMIGQHKYGSPESENRYLNLLSCPMYAWLYRYTGDSKYQVEGDQCFQSGVTADPGDGIGWSGKNFSQNYRWSFDYVNWRSNSTCLSQACPGDTAYNPNIVSTPAITSLSPASVTAFGKQFTLTINGTGFVPTSLIQWNGNSVDIPTTYISSTQLTAIIPEADITSPSSVAITVINPSPGGVSSSQTLSISDTSAIVFNTAAHGSSDGGSNSWNFNITITSRPSRVLICGTHGDVSGLSDNGNAMVLINSANNLAYYWLASPPAGTNNISVNENSSSWASVNCASYSGVSQDQPTNTIAAFGIGSATTTLTTQINGAWLSGISVNGTGNALVAGPGTILRGANNQGRQLGDSHGPEGSPGAYSITFISGDGPTVGVPAIAVELDPIAPPSVPNNLVVSDITTSSLNLSWASSTDPQDLDVSYEVFRNGTLVTTTTETSFNDSGLSPQTSYSYTVMAYNSANIFSAESDAVSATTAALLVPPPAPSSSGGGGGGRMPLALLQTSSPTPSPTITPVIPPVPTPSCTITTTLRLTYRGTQVKCLQTKLNISPVDGIFGSKTKTAVIVFQKANKLTPDGVVGLLTRRIINKIEK